MQYGELLGKVVSDVWVYININIVHNQYLSNSRHIYAIILIV
jgi:hypothetical protein